MRRHATLAALALALGATGCSFATTSVAGQSSVNGEAWYVRTTGIFFITFSTKVFYCPPPGGAGPVTCTEAQMNDEGGDTPMPNVHVDTGDSDKASPKPKKSSDDEDDDDDD